MTDPSLCELGGSNTPKNYAHKICFYFFLLLTLLFSIPLFIFYWVARFFSSFFSIWSEDFSKLVWDDNRKFFERNMERIFFFNFIMFGIWDNRRQYIEWLNYQQQHNVIEHSFNHLNLFLYHTAHTFKRHTFHIVFIFWLLREKNEFF